MRLTLRTMLAYLDDVLDPADAEILGKKISDSEFATTLVNRIGTVSKKVRMDAPKLNGKGMGNDANTVAEYLDSTLPQDRVGDLERICLESDRHLAEVAACHQVLTIVLGKPADVSQELRDKIYQLGHPDRPPQKTRPPVPAGHTNGKPAIPAAPPVPPEVPDYLRAGRPSSAWIYVATIAAAFLIAALGLRAMGEFNSSHPLMTWIGGSGGTTVAEAPVNTPVPAPPENANSTPATPSSSPENSAARLPSGEPEPESSSAPPAAGPAPEVSSEPAAAPLPGDVAAEAPAPTPAPGEVAPAPGESAPGDSPPAAPAPPAPMPPAVVAAPAEFADGMDVGRFLSDEQVLATLNPEDGLWYRKPRREVLTAGEQLLVLPTFRPQVALPSGVQATFAGESAVQMEPPGASGASRMSVAYGHFVIVTVGAAGAQVELNLAGIEGVATLVDADSELAVRVARWLPPGSDPEAAPALPVVELFTTSGRVTWQQSGQEPANIDAGHVRYYVGSDPPETHGPFLPPGWLDPKSTPAIDRDTSLILQDLLAAESDKPLNLSLQERLTDRRVNLRALVARCLGSLGAYEPLLKDLGDAKLASYWQGEAESLQQALVRSPDEAARVRDTIERQRATDAAVLYRLLWGFSQEQLDKGAAVQLVKNLEHEQMDVRVLTFLNLLTITGAQEFYRPERSPSQSEQSIRNWKERLNKKSIAYKAPPTPLEHFRPLPKGAAGAVPAGVKPAPGAKAAARPAAAPAAETPDTAIPPPAPAPPPATPESPAEPPHPLDPQS